LNSLASPQTVFALENSFRHYQQQEPGPGTLVIQSTRSDASPALRSIRPIELRESDYVSLPLELPNPILPKALNEGATGDFQTTPAPQPWRMTTELPAPLLSFDGVTNLFGGWPPDTQGDIGPEHYIQWINLHFAIWRIDKQNNTAALVYGPVSGNTLFQGFGGPCASTNHGDPITLYDPFEDRWFMSQFALPNYPNGPFYQCIAVSASPDPTGSWYRYEFQIPVNKMNDYPKFAVWPNAYFMTVNQFNAISLSWGGAAVAALERQAMLIGAPARMVFIDLYNVNPDFGGILPADFDGKTFPPVGAPGYFTEWDDGAWIGGQDAVRVWEFDLDWEFPDEASFGLGGNPNLIIPTMNVDPSMCGMLRNCIPQPGTATRVDAISDRLMYRLQYRNFGGYATLVSNHTIDVDGNDRAGIHWFELRKDVLGSSWSLYQEGVFSPDGHQRWMGSLAMDHVGNMALGYSVSSATVYPSARYTARLSGDALGTMPQGEQTLVAGSGSQTGSNRWGDYSMMGLDPVDDCTFWYTQEYVAATGTNTWKTRIGAFRLPGCSIGPQGVLTGRVSESATSQAIEGASVRASLSPTQTLATHTNQEGDYLIVAPVGTYTVTASSFGYYPQSINSVEIFSGTETVRDFALEIAATHTISGVVRDFATGWPLYAQITPLGAETDPFWNDPVSGSYSLSLPEGSSFLLSTQAYLDGYVPNLDPIDTVTEDLTVNINLEVEESICITPGFQPEITAVYSSSFEIDNGGLVSSGVTSWAWGTITSGPGAAHSGSKGWATNLAGNYNNNENGFIYLPSLDLSGFAGQTPALSWWQWLDNEARYDFASIEASDDGGLSWQTVYGLVSGRVDVAWKSYYLTLDPSYAVDDLRLRFRFTSDGSVTYAGWYIDDLVVGAGQCLPQSGSLLVGNVLDGNTLAGLNNAFVIADYGSQTTTQPTPEDLAVSDGFYVLFSPAGSHVFTATYGIAYQPENASIDIPINQTITFDFLLSAGWLSLVPEAVEVALELGDIVTHPLTMTNQGGVSVDYELVELKGGVVPLGPYESPSFAVKSFKGELHDSQGLGVPASPEAAPLAAGDVIQSWIPEGVVNPWSAAYDAINDTIWVSSPAPFWNGTDRIYEVTLGGSSTGRSHLHSPPHSSGPADMSYNWNTGNFWIMNVNTGIANCIYEIDPDQGYTGEVICPQEDTGFTTSQRGLAYDPDTDTWFAGSWNDLMIHRFDSSGNLLSSVNTGLAIAGLAYNPETQHLFVLTNENLTRVSVLDVADEYALIGQFAISEGFGSYSGGGLEFDCDGNLWAVDLGAGRVVQLASGEEALLCQRDVPWISSQPVSGTLAADTTQPITLTFNADASLVDQPGHYNMQIKVRENTPYLVANLPVTMTVNAPATFGKLDGLVQGLGYCDFDPEPLQNASVLITSSGGMTSTVQTDETGYYQRWLDQAGSPFTVTVSAAEHLPGLASAVIVTAAMTTTVDVDLFWESSCVQVAPSYFDVALKSGKSLTQTVSITNSGHADTPYRWHEIGGSDEPNPPSDLDWLEVTPDSGSLAAGADALVNQVRFDAAAPGASQPGVYTATLMLETNDPDHGYLSLPITMTVLPLEYGVALNGDMADQDIPGQMVTYTLTISNTSEGLTDTIQLSLGAHEWPTGLSTFSVGPISSGAAAQVAITVQIPETVLPLDQDQVVVTASSAGDPAKNDTVTLTTTAIEPLADLTLEMSASHDPVWVGQPLTYTLVITNQGSTKSPHTMLVDVLSSKLIYLSDDAGCTLNGTVLSCELGTLDVEDSRRIEIRVAALSTGVIVNHAVVTSEAQDPQMADNFVTLFGQAQGFLTYFPWIMR
jgi:uncharacterized repeat protein (TIGR01451 family)